MTAGSAPPTDEDDDWQFELDEVGPDARDPDPIEPGSPALENVFFVLVGVALALGVLASLL